MVRPELLIIGAAGQIGTRYRHVLNYLGRGFISHDINFIQDTLPREVFITHKLLKDWRHLPVLVCTPSHTHYKTVKRLMDLGYTKFLVEKPVFTEGTHYYEALDWRLDGISIHAAMNYKELDDKTSEGFTVYKNFYAGKEKTKWNLFQPVALARGDIEIDLRCPIWTCYLNGKKISLEQINQSYLEMIKKYLSNDHRCVTLSEAHDYFYKVERWFSLRSPSDYKPDSPAPDSREKLFDPFGTEKTYSNPA